MAQPDRRSQSAVGLSFSSVLKGRLAERIVVTLLERGGFRVTRLGIEELFDEIKYMQREQYLNLGLPQELRTLPDLLVADPKVSWAVMLEVKYRKRFDLETARELHSTLTDQRRCWPQAWALMMIAEPFVEAGRFHQDYIRLIPPENLHDLFGGHLPVLEGELEFSKMGRLWNSLPMLTKLFYHAHGDDEAGKQLAKQFWEGADFVTTAIKDLRNL